MRIATISKDKKSVAVKPNLTNYPLLYHDFTWQEARTCIDGLPDGALNIAYEAVDRHLKRGLGEKTAILWLSKDGHTQTLSYRELSEQTSRFASVLQLLGVRKGDRVFGLLGRTPGLYIALLGSLKNGSVFSPLFSAFGPEPIRSRMSIGDARVLVTTERLYRKKVMPWRDQMPGLKHILLLDTSDDLPAGCLDLNRLLAGADPTSPAEPTDPEDMALLHFTSGTTGTPKGAVHAHQAVLYHILSSRYALDLHPDDTYWCTADPGWVTGTSYGVIAPLCTGVTMVVDEAEFDAAHWYDILQKQQVSVWYTAPTAIRMLMKAGDELAQAYDLSHLRFMASVGEPLNPEAVLWSQQVLGRPFHDNWWQTETGGIMLANFASEAIKPGSMGRPLPGIEAAIVKRDIKGALVFIEDDYEVGELALKCGWPSMFRGYLDAEDRYQSCFQDGWYLSGDLASRDVDGYYWFVGRADDVIKSAGHLVGPFEVESVLLEHPSVAEAAVIGIPDPVVGEMVKAYVALKAGFKADEALRKTLLGHARKYLGASIAPKEIVFRDNLPKTRSGKIMRRLLKARELGLPEGDISTLESDET
ncbi:acetate--CoA ligase [Pontibacterium sp. N1Y112]|uniref:acetate--CoA ligase n=1 Tax=Pontibacterium sinense TaxID=2781979 RepID=A0A8J7FEB2_9GAMM|nr:acetate--CoA ligase [Pontibacterium sinense]MBE9398091.1 acetate--CoA ligase [Pontibacterium sinense]